MKRKTSVVGRSSGTKASAQLESGMDVIPQESRIFVPATQSDFGSQFSQPRPFTQYDTLQSSDAEFRLEQTQLDPGELHICCLSVTENYAA